MPEAALSSKPRGFEIASVITNNENESKYDGSEYLLTGFFCVFKNLRKEVFDFINQKYCNINLTWN